MVEIFDGCIEWREASILIEECFAVFPLHIAEQYTYNDGTTSISCSCGKRGVLGTITSNNICYGRHPAVVSISKDPTQDIKRIDRFGNRWGQRGVGIHCGSSHCWVLEVHAPEGLDELKALTRNYGNLPDTRTVVTGSGGIQYYFSGWIDKLHSGKLTPHIDVIGNCGNAFVVAPPTRHHSGRRYEYIKRSRPLDAPEWLVSLVNARTFPQSSMGTSADGAGPAKPGRRQHEIAIERLLTPEQFVLLRMEGSMLRGSHPVHGPAQERNFTIDLERNWWFCNRCESSGGLIEFAAVLAGICRCEEFKRGQDNPLRGTKYIDAVSAATFLGLDKDELRKYLEGR